MRKVRLSRRNFQSLAIMAWKMGAIHTASSTRVQTSQMRNSSVGYEWFGRTSHQIFDPSGIVFVRTSVSTRYEKSSHDWNVRGMPLRGKLRKMILRWHPTYIPVIDRKSTRLNSSHT